MEASADAPKVTVIVTTYNHEPFIRTALDSVLRQRTMFPFDVIIIEDCSTDRTRDIVQEYQRRYPALIRLILPETNQCSNVNFMKAVAQTSSPYFAILDGDDYWTSPLKLQKQVEFLERHPECSISYHNVRLEWEDGREPPRLRYPPDQATIVDIGALIDACIVQSCTAMIRRSAIDRFPPWYDDDPSADWTLFLLAAMRGKIGYVDADMAVYRQHAGGYWSSLGASEQQRRIQQQYDAMLRLLPPVHHTHIATARAFHAAHAVAKQPVRRESPG